MFDISSKTNKYGDLAYVETNDEKKENLDYRFKRKFSIELPEIKSSINLSYEYDSLANSTVLDQDYFETLSAEIKTGKKTLKVNLDTPMSEKDKIKSVRQFDFNNLVRTVCTYAYFQENFDDLVMQEKSKRELKKLSLEELEALTLNGEKAYADFKKSITSLCSGEKRPDAQELADKLFGEGKIDVDKIVEANIDRALAKREKDSKGKEEREEQEAY